MTVKVDDSELDSVIMMGWLEKSSPQGYDQTESPDLEVLDQPHPVSVCLCLRVLGSQKRWVRLEPDYLRYFEKDKVTRSFSSEEPPGELRPANLYNV